MEAQLSDSHALKERQSATRSAGIVSLSVMGSRLLGLVRDQVFAALFGAGFLKDVFDVGFRIPNLLRDLFAEGALSAAFVKTFTQTIETKGEVEAWRLANLVLNGLAVLLSVIVILGILFAPQIIAITAHGFTPEKAHLATVATRIMFPFLILVALAAVAMGVLNSKGKFAVPASASTMFNIGSIVGGLLFAYWLSGGGWVTPRSNTEIPSFPAQWALIGMAIGTLIGGIFQFAFQIPSLRRVGFHFRFILNFTDPGVRQVIKLMTPALIGTAAVQINVLVNTFLASSIPGGIGWLSYSFRLMQFPIGIFGVAIGTATLPLISRYAARNDIRNFRATLSSSIGLVFVLTIPAAFGLITLSQPIVALLFERGAFRAADTQMVAAALAGWSIGLIGYSAIKILSPAFYALDDTRTPMIISLISIFVNVIGSYMLRNLFARFGVTPQTPSGYAHVGMALSTSLVAITNFIALAFFMRRRIGRLEGRQLTSTFLKVLIASTALSITSFITYRGLLNILSDRGLTAHFIETFVPIITGSIIFLSVAHLLKIRELDQALRSITIRFTGRTT